MRRRKLHEIQSLNSIPMGCRGETVENSKIKFVPRLDEDFGDELITSLTMYFTNLVPTYTHKSIYVTCSDGTGSSDLIREEEYTKKILYNDVYQYPGTEYHRDNYLMIPLSVPPMSLSSEVFDLDSSVLDKLIPNVSTDFDLTYDYTFFTDSSICNIVSLAESPETVSLPGTFNFILSGGRFGVSDDCEVVQCYRCYDNLIAPLDNVTIHVQNVSDEYAYVWEDVWDMSVINTFRGSRRPPKEESSSSSQPPAGTGAVYLCKIDQPPTGNGGNALVTVISVDGSGAVNVTGQSLTVNVPSI